MSFLQNYYKQYATFCAAHTMHAKKQQQSLLATRLLPQCVLAEPIVTFLAMIDCVFKCDIILLLAANNSDDILKIRHNAAWFSEPLHK